MALPPAFLDELRARTPLHGLIGRKTRLVRNGRQWKGCCPFHNEKTPSFYVYDDHFHCFGCGAHGDAISFVMQTEGAAFPEAVERLAGEAGLEVPKATPQAAERERRAKDLYGVCAAAEAAFRRRLALPEGREALAYLKQRGLSDATIAHFGLGWSGEGRGALAADLRGDGITPEQLAAAGLMKPRDPDRPEAGWVDMYFNRVIFPIRDRRGRTISFGGRILGDGQPKYVNGPETELFSKRRSLYGLDLAREGAFRGGTVVVVEGYMDVIALHQAGFGGAVAPLGTALTAEQLEALWQISPEPVLCFDGDAAGAKAAARSAELALPLLAPDRSLRLATIAGGDDPDTLVSKGGPPAFQAVLDGAKPLSVALFDLLSGATPPVTPEQRAGFRNRLEEAARTIPDKALAAEYRRSLLDRFFASGRSQRPAFSPAGKSRAAWTPRGRPGELASIAGLRRMPIDQPTIRLERARNLLAILIRHPALLPEVEEALSVVEMPQGECEALRQALLRWLSNSDVLDSDGLMDHLRQAELDSSLAWAVRGAGLCQAAHPEAQPKDALDGWWHFFGLLRGEAELVADIAKAKHQCEDAYRTGDEGVMRAASVRITRLVTVLSAIRGGEVDQTSDAGAGDVLV
jgi:DNA primase